MESKEIKPVNPKGNQPWIFTERTDAEAETPILWPPDVKSQLIGKDSDAGERLKAGREGDDRGWGGWMTSLTRWTWVWVNSGSWWWTERPGVLRFMWSQRVGHDWVTELNWTKVSWKDKPNLRQFTTVSRERLGICVCSNFTPMDGLPEIQLKLYEHFSHVCECASFW